MKSKKTGLILSMKALLLIVMTKLIYLLNPSLNQTSLKPSKTR